MNLTKRFIVILLCALLCAPTAMARQSQDQQRDAQANNTLSQDVLIIIQQEKVRFTAQKPVEQMQLQVFNQTGEVVYDSGAMTGTEINWPLQNGNGETIKSGLYAYTLSIKEAGAETARVRRGHFIVDRAKDRDGVTDKLWMTSKNDGGVGGELTVARDENVTVAGAVTNNERSLAQRSESPNREDGGRKVEAETQAQTSAVKEGAAAGTVGRIAKFTSATEIGDSLMFEDASGKIGIGTTAPVSPLHVQGEVTSTGPNAAYFFHDRQTPTSNNFWAWYAQNNAAHFWQSGAGNVMSVALNGNVGIGTTTPFSRLTVRTPTASYGFSHTDGQVNLSSWVGAGQSGASGGWFGTRSNHALHFYTGDSAPMMTIATTGSIGIGTPSPDPFRKLDIVGSGATAAGIRSTNNRAFLSLTSTLNGQSRTWSVESGVYGLQDTFGIFNWQTGRALMLAPSGLLTVNALQITGGADFAESFDVNLATTTSETLTKVEPGLVVSIDPAHPGKLALSTQAHDRRVAGIISGAGGVKPGMMMSQEGTLADGKHPVALSGRVYCWVDASYGAIEPGDLLTTSATPGHAMKATDPAKAQGAIIGKAMTGLKEGKGLALVLVTLQ